MNIAILTARGGSKRIPRKNIRTFAGKPMIAWPIQTARESGLFDRIIVSTDSPEIAETAQRHGAEIPFLRPAELSGDHTPTAPVLEHALRWLGENGGLPRFACCIYPTAPFITSRDLTEGLTLVKEHGAPVAFGATTFGFPIFRALRRLEDGSVAMFWPEHELTRSQDLPEALHDAGQFYWVNAEAFLSAPRLFCPGAQIVVLPRYRVQDIDTPEDWARAETMAQILLRTKETE